jgi:hypothetical protein
MARTGRGGERRGARKAMAAAEAVGRGTVCL